MHNAWNLTSLWSCSSEVLHESKQSSTGDGAHTASATGGAGYGGETGSGNSVDAGTDAEDAFPIWDAEPFDGYDDPVPDEYPPQSGKPCPYTNCGPNSVCDFDTGWCCGGKGKNGACVSFRRQLNDVFAGVGIDIEDAQTAASHLAAAALLIED